MNSYSHIFSKTHTGIDIDQLWIPCSGGSNTGCECFQKYCFSLYHEIYLYTRHCSYIYSTISWNTLFSTFFENFFWKHGNTGTKES